MGIRDSINQGPGVALAVVCAAVASAAILRGSNCGLASAPGRSFRRKSFFSSDDGATVFEDESTKVVPFMNDGRETVRAHVYTIDGGKTRWVAYLEKPQPSQPFVKKPGKGVWAPRDSQVGLKIIEVNLLSRVTRRGIGGDPTVRRSYTCKGSTTLTSSEPALALNRVMKFERSAYSLPRASRRKAAGVVPVHWRKAA